MGWAAVAERCEGVAVEEAGDVVGVGAVAGGVGVGGAAI